MVLKSERQSNLSVREAVSRFESSFSSTVAIDDENPSKQTSHTPKCVTFDNKLKSHIYHEGDRLRTDETWYTAEEMERFALNTWKRASRVITKRCKSTTLGNKLFEFCCLREEDEVQATTHRGLVMLYHEMGNDLVGMESLLFDTVKEGQKRRQAILEAIREIRGDPYGDDITECGKASESISAPSRRWFQIIGSAQFDAHSLTNEYRVQAEL